MNKIADSITRAKKILGHIFTGKLLKQLDNNSNYASMNRTIDDYASIKDALVHLTGCGFTIAKLKKNSDFLILESNADEGGELYAIAITNKQPKIDDLEDGDIRQWNPNSEGNFIDLKSNGDVKITTKNSEISSSFKGEITIKSGSLEIKIQNNGKISIGNGSCDLVDSVFQIAKILSTTTTVALGSQLSSAGDFSTLMTKLSSLKL